MTAIRHICNGQEYRYHVETGEVFDNYGVHVTTLYKCDIPQQVRLYPANSTYMKDLIAYALNPNAPDDKLARFAIAHTEANTEHVY